MENEEEEKRKRKSDTNGKRKKKVLIMKIEERAETKIHKKTKYALSDRQS